MLLCSAFTWHGADNLSIGKPPLSFHRKAWLYRDLRFS